MAANARPVSTRLASSPSQSPAPSAPSLVLLALLPIILSLLFLTFLALQNLLPRSFTLSLPFPFSLLIPQKLGGYSHKTSVESLHHTLTSLSAYRSSQQSSLSAKKRSFRTLGSTGKRYAQALGYQAKLEEITRASATNADLVDGLIGLGKRDFEGGWGWRKGAGGGRPEPGRVIEMLKHFVRDWSTEGVRERSALFTPILSQLEDLYPSMDNFERDNLRILVPGCGLGRLAYEISDLGFDVDANDYSYFMNIASRLIFKHTESINEHRIFPNIHSFSHHRTAQDMIREVRFPDVLPKPTLLSFQPGDFLELYRQPEVYDAVVTLFFIDTAQDIVGYLETIYRALKPGGYWINEGPLLWAGNPRMECSLDEVLHLARMIGFEQLDLRSVDSDYTGTLDGLFRYIYEAQYWVMIKPKLTLPDSDVVDPPSSSSSSSL